MCCSFSVGKELLSKCNSRLMSLFFGMLEAADKNAVIL